MEDNSPEGLKRETTAGLLSLLDYVKTKVPAADLADALEQLVRDYAAHPNSEAVGISTLHDTLRGVLHQRTGWRQTGPGQWAQDTPKNPGLGNVYEPTPPPAPRNPDLGNVYDKE